MVKGELRRYRIATVIKAVIEGNESVEKVPSDQKWGSPNGLPIRDRCLKAKYGGRFFGKSLAPPFPTGSTLPISRESSASRLHGIVMPND